MKQFKQQLAPGTVLAGRYVIRETLGLGGMACVYLAEDLETRMYVALKVMRDEISDDPEFIRRFATEARAAASLDHPNIVRVLDYGQDRSIRYIVQEYVHGLTLKELIQRQGSLDWQLAVPLLIQISLALEHAHRRGIIHRDLKPQNILVTEDMVAKVTDFGIARASNANTITLTGGVAFGSVHYFSPEQARGGDVTARSDLYSLGIMLYEMLTGELPFDGESSVAVAIKQLQEMPLRPSSLCPRLPRALDDIIYKAIQKSPERRYQSAHEFVDELDRFLLDPSGRYGVIQTHQPLPQDNAWERSTSALGIQEESSDFHKMQEIEKSIKKSRYRRYRDNFFLISLLVILLVVAGIFFSYLFDNFRSLSSKVGEDEVVVGSYVGRSLDDVRAEIAKRFGPNVQLEVETRENETVEPGNVFQQEPQPERKVSKDHLKIKLVVSLGKEEIPVPDVRNMEADAAKKALSDASFFVDEQREYSETVPKDHVISMSPEAGTKKPKNTTIFLKISNGSAKTTVPPLEGLSWADAMKVAKEHNLVLQALRSVAKDDHGDPVDVPENERVIVNQQINAGEAIDSGTAIPVEYGTKADFEAKMNPGIEMPDWLGKPWPEVERAIAKMGQDAIDSITVLRVADSSIPLEHLVVLSQSIPAGQTFKPKSDHLEIRIGLPKNGDDSDDDHDIFFPWRP